MSGLACRPRAGRAVRLAARERAAPRRGTSPLRRAEAGRLFPPVREEAIAADEDANQGRRTRSPLSTDMRLLSAVTLRRVPLSSRRCLAPSPARGECRARASSCTGASARAELARGVGDVVLVGLERRQDDLALGRRHQILQRRPRCVAGARHRLHAPAAPPARPRRRWRRVAGEDDHALDAFGARARCPASRAASAATSPRRERFGLRLPLAAHACSRKCSTSAGMSSLSLAQRRQLDRHDVQPVEEVLAEAPLGDLGLQVLVGRGDARARRP